MIECINEGCDEYTENIGGLCPACMGKAQKRAEETRKYSNEALQNRSQRILSKLEGKGGYE